MPDTPAPPQEPTPVEIEPSSDATEPTPAEVAPSSDAAKPAQAEVAPPEAQEELPRAESFWTGIRRPVPLWAKVVLGVIPFLLIIAAWLVLTWGDVVEERIISSVILPSPWEVLQSFHSLWVDKHLAVSIAFSLKRVAFGFAVAAVIAVPLGIAMGSFSVIKTIFNPLAVVGGYLPIVALVPLTMSWFGTTELQKIMFLAIGSLVYLLPLVVKAVDEVDHVYLQTAYTLGASKLQVVRKVLVPIALGPIFDAMRFVFGVGWTYIILAEMVDAQRGLGYIIIGAQRHGPKTHIYLVLIVIMLVAFLTDRLLKWMNDLLFPYRRKA